MMLKNVTNWQAYCKLLLKYNNLLKMSKNKKVTNCYKNKIKVKNKMFKSTKSLCKLLL